MHEREAITDLPPVIDRVSARENFSENIVEIDVLRQDSA